MLDYKNIILYHYSADMSLQDIAIKVGAGKTSVYDFIKAFEKCEKLSYPLPDGITNYAIYELVYGHTPGVSTISFGFEKPDYANVFQEMTTRKNMTLRYLWGKYQKNCITKGLKPYQYRQFCDNYSKWCDENSQTLHIPSVSGEKMEVDFAGKTFSLTDPITDEISDIVVFVAILPYSQYIYAEGMISTKEPQWIEVNNHALSFFGGVPSIVVCDNCKQAVIANRDWIEPELNKDYAAWAEHYHTVILPAKVRKPRYKSSVENAVGILEKGFFHDLEENRYFSLARFNEDLWKKLKELNDRPFEKKTVSRSEMWYEEKLELRPLPSTQYQYMERKTAKVSSDFHVRFDNAYYSVDKAYLHKSVEIAATSSQVYIYSDRGELLVTWDRATRRGEWKTNPEHLPETFKHVSEWNREYFIQKAMTVGPKTTEMIEKILASRDLEVQTYRLCLGILNFTKKYSKLAVEDCCRLALETGHATYSFVKNTIPQIAEDIGSKGFNTKLNEERNKGAYIMDPHMSDVDNLLKKSVNLARKEALHD